MTARSPIWHSRLTTQLSNLALRSASVQSQCKLIFGSHIPITDFDMVHHNTPLYLDVLPDTTMLPDDRTLDRSALADRCARRNDRISRRSSLTTFVQRWLFRCELR